jgi:tRNA (uracil-5-)-methyltransferase TRM9
MMNDETAERLIELNRRFYADFGAAFAATRRRIQPGIAEVLRRLQTLAPEAGAWLDVGCGGGQVAAAWAAFKRKGSYVGIDFSLKLLSEARTKALEINADGLNIQYAQNDMSAKALSAQFAPGQFDGVLAFASLHHVPGQVRRADLLQALQRLLKPGGWLIHSEWQFQHSPRLMERVQPWERIGLRAADVENNDYLLDWRFALPGQAQQVGLRYVHLFTREELAQLAQAAGFESMFDFDSDGKEGNLALYQGWRKRL